MFSGLRMTEVVLELVLVTAMSRRVPALRVAVTMASGWGPVAMVTGGAKDPAPMFSSTAMLPESWFTTTMSESPSRSRSTAAMVPGSVPPDWRLMGPANEPPMLVKMETKLRLFPDVATTRSGRPSPSMSLASMPSGRSCEPVESRLPGTNAPLPVLTKMEMERSRWLVTARSMSPSPSKSAAATPLGRCGVA